jgi:hypothetical protein
MMWHTGQRVLLVNEQGTSLIKQSTMEQENITRQFYNGGKVAILTAMKPKRRQL